MSLGICLHGVDATDKSMEDSVVPSHNWLLEIDGLDEKWESGVPSDWEGELGMQDQLDAAHHILFAIQ